MGNLGRNTPIPAPAHLDHCQEVDDEAHSSDTHLLPPVAISPRPWLVPIEEHFILPRAGIFFICIGLYSGMQVRDSDKVRSQRGYIDETFYTRRRWPLSWRIPNLTVCSESEAVA